ncbi:MAG: hypothetical protein J1E99_01070 [Muribaculaceae bacterium]|nr:hypothetical protein [Muribaculaceae bacterium]
MLSEELETLIGAAIADGKITEKEREVLTKRAKAEGIDLEEFELILESRLHSNINVTDKKSDNHPREFVVKKLQARIDEILKDYESKVKEINENSSYYIFISDGKKTYDAEYDKDEALNDAERSRDNSILNVIENLYIPNNKDDILDLLNYLKFYTRKSYYSPYGFEVGDALKDKYNECLEIARHNFPNEPGIKEYLESKAKAEKREEDKKRKTEEDLARQSLARLKNDVKEAGEAYYKGSYDSMMSKRSKAAEAIITGFQLPEDKKDLLELIKYFKPFYNKKVWKDRDKNYKRTAKAYYNKYIEACELAKTLFPDDADFLKEFPQKKKGFLSWLGFGK